MHVAVVSREMVQLSQYCYSLRADKPSDSCSVPDRDNGYFFYPKNVEYKAKPAIFNGYLGVKGRGVKFTTHLYLVPPLRMTGDVIPLPHMPSRHAQSVV